MDTIEGNTSNVQDVKSPSSRRLPKKRLIIVFTLLFVAVLSISSAAAYVGSPYVRDRVSEILDNEEPGKISISSNPIGATVFLNGEIYGTTPLEIDLPEGNYSVRLIQSGYNDYFQSITIKKGDTLNITGEMEQILPVEKLAEWFTYNSSQYNFGFRYIRNWVISESSDDSTGNYVVNLENDKFIIKVQYIVGEFTMPSVLGKHIETYDLDNGNTFNVEESIDDLTWGFMMLESKEKQLFIEVIPFDNLTPVEDSVERDQLIEFLNSVWFTGSDLGEDGEDAGYNQPQSNVENRFVWQKESGIYESVDYTLENKQSFSMDSELMIQSVSPNGKWVLYSNPYNWSITISDTLGQNKQVLLPPIASVDNCSFYYDLGSGTWSPDSKYFLYKLYIWKYTGSDSGLVQEISAGGINAGFYAFNLETGMSVYLKDSSDDFLATWDQSSTRVYTDDYIYGENPVYKIKEYSVVSPEEINTYELTGVKAQFFTQFDVYDRDNVILAMTSLNDTGTAFEKMEVFTAKLSDGQIIKTREYTTLNDYIYTYNLLPNFPKFSSDMKYVIWDPGVYLNVETGKYQVIINGYNLELMYFDSNKIIGVNRDEGKIILFNLVTGSIENEIYATISYLPDYHLL